MDKKIPNTNILSEESIKISKQEDERMRRIVEEMEHIEPPFKAIEAILSDILSELKKITSILEKR